MTHKGRFVPPAAMGDGSHIGSIGLDQKRIEGQSGDKRLAFLAKSDRTCHPKIKMKVDSMPGAGGIPGERMKHTWTKCDRIVFLPESGGPGFQNIKKVRN